MTKVACLAFGLCAWAGFAAAQEGSPWEVSAGYQYTRVDLAGLQTQANLFTNSNGLPNVNVGNHVNTNGFNIGIQENLNSWFSGIFTLSGSYPTLALDVTPQLKTLGFLPPDWTAKYVAKASGQLYTFMFGPQFTLRRSAFVQPFVRPLVGGAYATATINASVNGTNLAATDLTPSEGGFALGGGAGFDSRVSSHVYLRTAVDYVKTTLFNATENNLMFSLGIAYRVDSHQ